MVKINLNYLGNLKTELIHESSGAKFITAAPLDNNGDGSSFSPTDMLAASYLSCMVTIMGIFADKNNIKLTKLEGSVEKSMAASPRRVDKLLIHIDIYDDIAKDDQEKLKQAAFNCPVAKSVSSDLITDITINFK
jgi:putative redox protein